MKKIGLAIAALVAVSGVAVAADMPVKVAAPVTVRSSCAQFGGFYGGAHGGYSYYNHKYEDKGFLGGSVDTGLPRNASLTDNSWNAGVQAGYNWQRNCTVFGVEADWSWSGLRAQETFFDGDAGTQDSLTVSSRMRWFGTARTRAGIVIDNLMLYATGGLAYAQFKRDYSFFQDAPEATAVFNSSSTRFGWTAGVGTEWALNDNWSIKSEFLYMRWVKDDQTFNAVTINGANFGVPGRSYVISSQDDAWITRIGVNYRWGGSVVR